MVEGIGDESNQGARSLLGKRVVGEVNIPCEDTEACKVCRNHAMQPSEETSSVLYRNHCPNRQALGMVKRSGAFAEYITLPVANLLVVPDGLPESHAVFVEPLAAAWRVIEHGLIKPSDQVAVLGDGRLGLLVADVLATENCGTSVTIIGKHNEKLRLLQDVVDATLQFDPSLINSRHETFDICIECTGSPSGLASALDLVKPAGRIVMKSTCSVARTPFPTHQGSATAKSVQIIGSRCGPFAPALDLLSSKRIDVQKYLDAVYPLERITEAMAHARRPGVVKVQVAML